MSDRSDRMDQDAQDLMTSINDPFLANDARALQEFSAMEDLKNEVLGFFKNRIAAIARAERIKELVYVQLEQRIQDGVLSFEQFMTLLMRLDRDNNDAADSILRSFQPAGNNGGGSLLTDIMRPESDKSELAKAFDNYSPEQLRIINETMKVMRDIVESGGTVSVDTADGKVPITEV